MLHHKKPEVDSGQMWSISKYGEVLLMLMSPIKNKASLMTRAPHVSFSVSLKESKGYRLSDPKTKKIVISNDVVFEETRNWD